MKNFLLNILLTHGSPLDFVTSQWQTPNQLNRLYLGYRLFFATLATLICIFSLTNFYGMSEALNDHHDSNQSINILKWFIYFPNWSFAICTTQFNWAAVMISAYARVDNASIVRRIDKQIILGTYRVYWVMNTIAMDVVPIVTLIFYFNKEYFHLSEVYIHMLNLILIFIDLLMISHPVVLIHCVYPLLYFSTYAVSTYVYYLFGGTNRKNEPFIYPSIDWDKPWSTLYTVCMCLALVVCNHCCFWLLYKIRVQIFGVCYRRRIAKRDIWINLQQSDDADSIISSHNTA